MLERNLVRQRVRPLAISHLLLPPLHPFTYRRFIYRRSIYRRSIYRLPIVPRIERQLEREHQKDLRCPAAHMASVADRVAELKAPAQSLEQVGVEATA